MKVAFVSSAAEPGGAERSLVDLMESLRRHDPSLRLWLIGTGEGAVAQMAREAGAEYREAEVPRSLAGAGDSALRFSTAAGTRAAVAVRAASALPAAFIWAERLRRALRDIRPDIVHTNDNKSHLVSAWLPLGGSPLVWHVRDFLGRRGVVSRALRPSARRVAGAIAISRAVEQDARRVLGRTPVRVVHNAVDTAYFSPGDSMPVWLDGLAGLPPVPAGTVRIGLVAAFARWKGHGLFLKAAARALAGSGSLPLRFYVVGGPIYVTSGSQHDERELRAEAERLGLSGLVGFTGFQRDVARVYRALDIVVHASTEPEPFGRTIVEAMACGRPVIVSREGGAAELFTDEDDALGFCPGDDAALAQAILRLSLDAGLRERLGRRARISAETRFSRERLGREVLAAYQTFMGSAPDRGRIPG